MTLWEERGSSCSSLYSIWVARLAQAKRTTCETSRKLLIPINISDDHVTLHPQRNFSTSLYSESPSILFNFAHFSRLFSRPRGVRHWKARGSGPFYTVFCLLQRSNLFPKQCAGLSAAALACDAFKPVTEPTLYTFAGRPSSRKGSR